MTFTGEIGMPSRRLARAPGGRLVLHMEEEGRSIVDTLSEVVEEWSDVRGDDYTCAMQLCS